MAIYTIQPKRSTLHGSFSREASPILTIQSGDTVRFETLDADWNAGPEQANGRRVEFCTRKHPQDSGHALIGPLYIADAKAGQSLAIHINELRVGTWGWSQGGEFSSAVNKRLGMQEKEGYPLIWELDATNMIGTSDKGHKIRLHPFMGVMGMPPDEPGIHSTIPPRYCGGNIDCKELIPGSTLYLPIPVDGGLFSVGDGHAVQGDGEVSGLAIECPMELVDLTFTVEDRALSFPRAQTPTSKITFGVHKDLHEASMIALEGMIDWMQELYGYERKEALNLASLLVDLRITQLVNDVVGVHAVLDEDKLII
ncbi:acetamidase/formamidase family protein [Brevibacillus laterosporus]|uniref:acetamidase/formamidase family protein n=1 Tax=Brevibacillus laterosporus TaxID=1465 RepID=UPI0003B1D417|nr:acetamidase/formamidase family protein [Brevibacillus laterosporus]ERM18016.1 acetamidase [Brevibacillus laterosporus PE36]